MLTNDVYRSSFQEMPVVSVSQLKAELAKSRRYVAKRSDRGLLLPSRWRLSARWGRHRILCTRAGIENGCQGACCRRQSFWPAKAGRNEEGCDFLGKAGCSLIPHARPVTCLLYPFVLNDHAMLVLHGRVPIMKHNVSPCQGCYGEGPMIVEANQHAFATLFGAAVAQSIIDQVKAGIDPEFDVPESVHRAYAIELELEGQNLVPIPRTALFPLAGGTIP
jgi:hypothetical protein